MTRFGGNWAELVELAQSPHGDDEAWFNRLLRAATAQFPGAIATWIAHQRHEGTAETLETSFAQTSRPEYRRVFDIPRGSLRDERMFRAFYFPWCIATTHLEVERRVPADVGALSREVRKHLGVGEVLGLITQPMHGEVLMMGAFLERPVALTAAERNDVPELDPDLARLRGVSAESIELWPALIAGRLSLVPRGSGKSRRLLLIENDPPAQRFRALARMEVDVLRHASRGVSTKLIAYALGVSPARVSNALASASAKVGTATHLELVRLGALLTRDPRLEAPERARLTASEREVLGLLQQGLSNEAIAKMRARSARTIANQVAALLRKTGTSSRRELAARTD